VAQALIERKLDVSILLSIQPRDVEHDLFLLLKRAGLKSVILAVDNFCQTVLERYRKFTTVEQNVSSIKILESLEIDAYLGIIMFDPWTTLEELHENLRVMVSLPYLRPWQILSKLEIYHGSPITVALEEQGLLNWDGYFGTYEYRDSRMQGVYLAIETIMKICHPSMQELDRFRWGNLAYSAVDKIIREHFKSELAQLNAEYNRDLLAMAAEIIQQQGTSATPLAVSKLADRRLQRRAQYFNKNALQAIKNLRQHASTHTPLPKTLSQQDIAHTSQDTVFR
jgi:hypothetical protein